MTFEPDIENLAARLIDACRSRGLRLATAESCTGGLVAGAITAIAGASDVFDAGFVTYSNAAKMRFLGVPKQTLAEHGAVSEATARAMAEGVLAMLEDVGLTLAVTGIAGPAGGTPAKPVGLVHIAVTRRGLPTAHRRLTIGDRSRNDIRLRALAEVLDLAFDQAVTAP